MKKTIDIDPHLLQKARLASGATSDEETVRLGLETLVRQATLARILALEGSEPHAQDVPRRREAPSAGSDVC